MHGPAPTTGSVLQGLPDIVDRGLLSLPEADLLIRNFACNFIPKFPFVVLAAKHQTAAHVKHKSPFLFLCILAATLPSAHALRKPVAEEIMRHVADRIVVGSERNLDLLKGLLVQAAWYGYPAQRGHTRLALFVQLCATMVHDLGLHYKDDPTLEEQRLLLGAYWVSVGYVVNNSSCSSRHCVHVRAWLITAVVQTITHSPQANCLETRQTD